MHFAWRRQAGGSPVIRSSREGDGVDLCKKGRDEWKVGPSCGEDLRYREGWLAAALSESLGMGRDI